MLFEVRVKPSSSKKEVSLQNGCLRVSVTASPQHGKANAEMIAVLAQWLDVGVSQVSVVYGRTSRIKRIGIPDEFESVYRTRLAALGRT